MYNITLIFKKGEEYVKRGYTAKFYDLTESGELTLYGFNGSDDECVLYVTGKPYVKAFIMNEHGVTIDRHIHDSV